MHVPWNSGVREIPPPRDSGVRAVHSVSSRIVPREKPQIADLYRAHFAYVWKSARRLGVPEAEVDDVVQETFLTVNRLLDRYEEQGMERGWIFSVLFRVVQRQRRVERRRNVRTEEGADLDAIAGSASRSPERSAETRADLRVVEEILDGLDPEKRAVFILSDVEERSLIEISEILGLNMNTTASRLRSAREHFDAAMARHRARDGWRYK